MDDDDDDYELQQELSY